MKPDSAPIGQPPWKPEGGSPKAAWAGCPQGTEQVGEGDCNGVCYFIIKTECDCFKNRNKAVTGERLELLSTWTHPSAQAGRELRLSLGGCPGPVRPRVAKGRAPRAPWVLC